MGWNYSSMLELQRWFHETAVEVMTCTSNYIPRIYLGVTTHLCPSHGSATANLNYLKASLISYHCSVLRYMQAHGDGNVWLTYEEIPASCYTLMSAFQCRWIDNVRSIMTSMYVPKKHAFIYTSVPHTSFTQGLRPLCLPRVITKLPLEAQWLSWSFKGNVVAFFVQRWCIGCLDIAMDDIVAIKFWTCSKHLHKGRRRGWMRLNDAEGRRSRREMRNAWPMVTI